MSKTVKLSIEGAKVYKSAGLGGRMYFLLTEMDEENDTAKGWTFKANRIQHRQSTTFDFYEEIIDRFSERDIELIEDNYQALEVLQTIIGKIQTQIERYEVAKKNILSVCDLLDN